MRSKDGAQLALRDMFCSDCTPVPTAATNVAAAAGDQIPLTTLPLSLLATNVALRDADSYATIINTENQKQGSYSLGDIIPGAGALKAIHFKFIDFENAGHVERLVLQGATPPVVAVAAVEAPAGDGDEMDAAVKAGIKKIDDTHYEIDKALVDKVLANPMSVAKGARIVPAVKNGKPDGFKLYAIRPSSVYAKIGLTNGDTLSAINGMELTTADKALEVYTKLRDATSLEVSITRRGKPMAARLLDPVIQEMTMSQRSIHPGHLGRPTSALCTLLLALAVLIPARGAYAQPAGDKDKAAEKDKAAPGGEDEQLYACKKRTGQVAVTFKPETELKDLITWVMGFTCKNFIYDPRIISTGKKVTVIAPNKMSSNEAYRLFLVTLSTMGLTLVPKGNVLRIVESATAKSETVPIFKKGIPGDEDEVVRYIVKPSYAQVETMRAALDSIRSPAGNVQVVGSLLLITDYASQIRDMMTLAKSIDVPGTSDGIYTIPILHGDATAARDQAQRRSSASPTRGAGGRRQGWSRRRWQWPGAPASAPAGAGRRPPKRSRTRRRRRSSSTTARTR